MNSGVIERAIRLLTGPLRGMSPAAMTLRMFVRLPSWVIVPLANSLRA